ncbi:TraB/GumN family protein [Pelagibius litoralis]|uniref:TraB/GumN family protein n=1 Tax=Pelagibius litoralis TaxID=374515 RepID=A0A967F1P5_9PROT|nr:TraB/GumN family protein [Pelagibius litoralis]NIA71531.1 TraB/GumN family protein [Pelagibius litoralis]
MFRSLLASGAVRLALSPLFLAVFLAASLADAASDPRFTQGVFWKVERDGASASHIFGTIHLSDPRLRELPEQIRQPFIAAHDVVFELPDDPEGPALMTQAMILSDGRRLDDILGPDLFAQVVGAAARYGLAPQALRPLKPWALSVFLVAPPAELARKAQGEQSLDEWLRSEAQRRGKAVHGLESFREQIAVFNGMTEAEQVAMVRDLVADSAKAEAEFAKLLQAYMKSDIGAIFAQMNDMSGVSDQAAARRFLQRLIYDRNVTMVSRMQTYLTKGNAFVAIGAAHLPGEGGVLDLLEKQGYRVTRVY